MFANKHSWRGYFLALLALLLFSFIIPILAAAETALPAAEQYAELIADIRQRLQIAEDVEHFSLELSPGEGEDILLLRWWQDDHALNIEAKCMESGELLEVSITTNNQTSGGQHFPAVNRQEALRLAEDYLTRLAPELKDYLAAEATLYYSRYAGYSIGYSCLLHGVPLPEFQVSLRIDPESGGLLNFRRYGYETQPVSADDPEALPSLEEFIKLLRERYPFALRYVSQSNSSAVSGNELTLEYAWEIPALYLLAENGEPFTRDYGYAYSRHASGYQGTISEWDAQRTALDSSLLQEICGDLSLNKLNKQLQDWARNAALDFDPDMEITDVQLYDSYLSLTLLDRASLDSAEPRGAWLQLDPDDGTLQGFWSTRVMNYQAKSPQSPPSREEALKIAAKAAGIIWPEEFAHTQLRENDGNDTLDSFSFTFTHWENNASYSRNSLLVNVHKESGKIISLFRNWDEALLFPDTTEAMAPEKALQNLLAISQPRLVYLMEAQADNSNTYHARLVYDVSALKLSLDAFSGEQPANQAFSYYLTIQGLPQDGVFTGYDDLDDDPDAEKIIATAEYLQPAGEISFRPDEPLTEYAWLSWLYNLAHAPGASGTPQERDTFYLRLENNGLLEPNRREPDRLLGNLEALQLMARFLNLQYYTRLGGAFRNPYNLSSDQAAAVALAAGVKAINWAEFRPKETLPRREAMLMLHNYLSR